MVHHADENAQHEENVVFSTLLWVRRLHILVYYIAKYKAESADRKKYKNET
jgi:hypothetical protein